MKAERDGSCGELLCGGDRIYKETNIERLVTFAEEMDEDGSLIPLFLMVLEMSLNSKEHSF